MDENIEFQVETQGDKDSELDSEEQKVVADKGRSKFKAHPYRKGKEKGKNSMWVSQKMKPNTEASKKIIIFIQAKPTKKQRGVGS